MLTTTDTVSTSSCCSTCVHAGVCKWRNNFIEAEKELKEKTKVNRNSDNEIYSIMNISISCKYYRTEATNRLFGNDWGISTPNLCNTPSDSTVGTPAGTKVYYTNNNDATISNVQGECKPFD